MKKKETNTSLSSDELYEMLKNKKKNQKKKTTKSLTEKNSKSKKIDKKIKEDEKDNKVLNVEEEKNRFKSDKAMVAKKNDVDNTIVKRILSGEYIYFDDVDKEYETLNRDDDFEGYVDVDTHDITKVVSEARFNSDYHESLVDDDEFGTVRMNRKIDDSRIIDKSLSNGKWYKDIDKTKELDTIIPIDDLNRKKKIKIRWSAVIVTLIFILLFIAALILIVWI